MNLDRCVARVLDLLAPEIQQRFVDEPLLVLREDLKLEVAPIEYLPDARSEGGACDGTSYVEDGVILYVPTPHSRRENFTLGHELGHWLIPQSDEVMGWILDQGHPEQLVETVCDRVAGADGQFVAIPAQSATSSSAPNAAGAAAIASLRVNRPAAAATSDSGPICWSVGCARSAAHSAPVATRLSLVRAISTT